MYDNKVQLHQGVLLSSDIIKIWRSLNFIGLNMSQPLEVPVTNFIAVCDQSGSIPVSRLIARGIINSITNREFSTKVI